MLASRLLRRVRTELRLSGTAAWRGLLELLNSNDLTHAASIAYYALLSLFPFLLLIISLLGVVTADEHDRVAVLGFVFRYFPTQLDFVTSQLDAFRGASLRLGVGGALALIWGSLAYLGFAPWISPLGALAGIFAVQLFAVFAVCGKRGLLAPR